MMQIAALLAVLRFALPELGYALLRLLPYRMERLDVALLIPMRRPLSKQLRPRFQSKAFKPGVIMGRINWQTRKRIRLSHSLQDGSFLHITNFITSQPPTHT